MFKNCSTQNSNWESDNKKCFFPSGSFAVWQLWQRKSYMFIKSISVCLSLDTWEIVLLSSLEVWRVLVNNSANELTYHFLAEAMENSFMIPQLLLLYHIYCGGFMFQMMQLQNSGASISLGPQVVSWKEVALGSWQTFTEDFVCGEINFRWVKSLRFLLLQQNLLYSDW